VILALILGLGRAGASQVSTPLPYKDVAGLKFTENKGQWDPKAKFLAQTNQVDYWVTSTGIVYNWHGPDKSENPELPKFDNCAVAVDFVGATGLGKPQGLSPRPGLANYYVGKTHANRVKSYGSAVIQDLYKGIDLVTYFDEQDKRPRYDLVVHPGADPNQIKMRFKGAKNLKVTKDGSVEYDMPFGKVREQRQMAYQKADDGPDYRFFPAQIQNPDGTVGFDTTGYKKDRTLVIDPVVWATYLGGTTPGSDGTLGKVDSIVVDSAKNTYVVGEAPNSGFPILTTGALHAVTNKQSMFVAKFDATGTCFYSTIYGGSDSGTTEGRGISFDASGNAYTVSCTTSSNIFTTDSRAIPYPTSGNAFLASFDGTGAVTLGTYVGTQGMLNGGAAGIATTSDGTSTIAYAGPSDVFNPDGSYSGTPVPVETYDKSGTMLHAYFLPCINLLGTGNCVALDSAGNIFVAGTNVGQRTKFFNSDAFERFPFAVSGSAAVCRIPAGSPTNTVATGTYYVGQDVLGGTGTIGTTVAIDAHDGVFLGGQNFGSSYLPFTPYTLTPGASEGKVVGFVARFSNNLRLLLQDCLFGSDGSDSVNLPGDDPALASTSDVSSITIDGNGNPMIAGLTHAVMPLTWDAYSGHVCHAYLARLSENLTTILFDTYFPDNGGNGHMLIATDSDGKFYVAGATSVANVPTTANAPQSAFDPSTGHTTGYVEVIDPTVPTGISRITSDRGAAPILAGGIGKQLNVSVYFGEPDGTNITLSSPDPTVQVNGGPSATFTSGQFAVLGATRVASFAVTANTVASPTTIPLTATNDHDGTTQTISVTVMPFIRYILVRPTALSPGQSFTVYVLPQEVPATDQILNITTGTSSDLPGAPTVTIKGLASGQSIGGATTATPAVGDFDASHSGVITATTLDGIDSASTSVQFTGVVISSAAFGQPTIPSEGSSNLVITTSAARTTDQTYTFTSSNPSLANDAQVFVPANATTGTAIVTLGPVFSTALTASVVFSDTVNGSKRSAPLKITTNRLTSASGPGTVVEGDRITINATTAVPMITPQTFRATSSYLPSIPSVNLSVMLGTTDLRATFGTNNDALTGPRTVTMSVQMVSGGVPTGFIKTIPITVLPLLTSIDLSGLTVQGGTDITGTVTLAEANNTSSPSFSLTSSNSVAFFDGSAPATVATGTATSIPFVIHTQRVTKATKVVITLPTPLGYRTKQFNVTVTP